MARKQMPISLSKEERAELDALVEEDRLSAGAVIRTLIHREFKRRNEKAPHNTVHRHAGKRAPK